MINNLISKTHNFDTLSFHNCSHFLHFEQTITNVTFFISFLGKLSKEGTF